MYRVTLTDTETAYDTSSAWTERASSEQAQHEAITFVSAGAGVQPAYHCTQHPDKTVYWLGSREASIEPPIAAQER